MAIQVLTLAEINRFERTLTAALGNADSTPGFESGGFPDNNVQVFGTFGGATVTIYGSNDPLVIVDNAAGTAWASVTAAWYILTDPLGNNLAFSSAGGKQILTPPRFMAAVSAGGSGTSLTTIFGLRRGRP